MLLYTIDFIATLWCLKNISLLTAARLPIKVHLYRLLRTGINLFWLLLRILKAEKLRRFRSLWLLGTMASQFKCWQLVSVLFDCLVALLLETLITLVARFGIFQHLTYYRVTRVLNTLRSRRVLFLNVISILFSLAIFLLLIMCYFLLLRAYCFLRILSSCFTFDLLAVILKVLHSLRH